MNTQDKKYRYVVVGGGTAGVIFATYLQQYWKDKAEIVLLYDHTKPGIGVGESLTPTFMEYLNFVDITENELIQNVNATIKYGMKFVNWCGTGKYFYHTFKPFGRTRHLSPSGIVELCDGDNYLQGTQLLHNLVNKEISVQEKHSLHIDATLFSKYVENKFKDKLTIIDGDVINVIKDGDNIEHLQLKNGEKVYGDIFIDATGFQSTLFKHMGSEWVDMTDWLPLNSFIPNPVVMEEFDKIQPYTTTESTDNGWILQVPLQNRWGSGYLFCSDFTSNEEAYDKFNMWSINNYGKEINNSGRVMNFKSGYWKDQWVGNCIATGLCSGFAEPLEATNIHHTIIQVIQIVERITPSNKSYNYDRKMYNKSMNKFYENIYLYIRYCYNNNRTDSEFWKYMTNNVPVEIKDLEEKLKYDPISAATLPGLDPMFKIENFMVIAKALNIIDTDVILDNFNKRNLLNENRNYNKAIMEMDKIDFKKVYSIDHKKFIESIKNAKA